MAAAAAAADKLDTSIIKEWRSIVTLIVFILTSKLGTEDAAIRRVN
jgi:hypothetical protein